VSDFVCDADYRVHLPDGKYVVQCVKYDASFVLGKAKKLFLHFRIIDGEHQGQMIFMAFNMAYNERIKQGSKYYKCWTFVNGWRKPSRNAKMSPRLFLNKVFQVKTRTVRPLHNGKEMPDSFHYSVVDSILEVMAG